MDGSFPGLPRQFNAADYFVDRHLRGGRGAAIAFECGPQQVSYAELAERVNRCGNGLRQALGVRVEERLLLLLLDTPEFAYAFFGAIKIGAVPVPVNTLLHSEDYRYLLNDCRARVAIVSQTLWPLLSAIPREELKYLREVVVVGDPAPGTLGFADLLQSQPDVLQPADTCKDDAAFWLYSSGSTGPPKGCVHLQHDMVVCSELYAKSILGITAADRCFSVAKMFFAYGLGNALYCPLAAGATSILWPGKPHPADIYSVIERHRPTLFYSVPTSYSQMLNYHQEGSAERTKKDFDLSSIRLAVSAGEVLPAPVFERFRRRFGVEILDGIGSTEVLHIFISNRPGEAKPGCSGSLVPGYQAKLLDDHGEPVPTGEIGNLYVSGDSICAGYWNQHEKTLDTIAGRWIRTGDKYRQDAEGKFYHAGRSDDMMKVGGIWVSPAEVEIALLEHEAVEEAGVVGVKDADGLMKPVAFVVLKAEAAPSPKLADELVDFVRARLPEYKRPRKVEFVASLPKTATGKLQRYRLREQAALAGRQNKIQQRANRATEKMG